MLGETVSSVEVPELFALLCNSYPEYFSKGNRKKKVSIPFVEADLVEETLVSANVSAFKTTP